MLTIGFPGGLAFLFYFAIVGLFWRLLAYTTAKRNPDSALAKAMLFIH